MKRLIFLIISISLLLCSCVAPENSIMVSNDELPTIDFSTTESSGEVYILNRETKKYHKRGCIYSVGIKKDNYYATSDMNYIKSRKYEKCSVCFGK